MPKSLDTLLNEAAPFADIRLGRTARGFVASVRHPGTSKYSVGEADNAVDALAFALVAYAGVQVTAEDDPEIDSLL